MTQRERPIIFSAKMVREILAGRKTQTRRALKPQPVIVGAIAFSPYGIVGDRLWVRETFAESVEPENHKDAKAGYTYRADWDVFDDIEQRDFPWSPPIHMPRWASRITLEVIGVRVERVQDISESDASEEGVRNDGRDGRPGHIHRELFRKSWDSINAKRGFGWDANPWVWVVGFQRITYGPGRVFGGET